MSYIPGDYKLICDKCGMILDIESHLLYPLNLLKENGWEYEISIPECYYKHEKPMYKQIESTITLKCNLCIRKQKINKVRDRTNT